MHRSVCITIPYLQLSGWILINVVDTCVFTIYFKQHRSHNLIRRNAAPRPSNHPALKGNVSCSTLISGGTLFVPTSFTAHSDWYCRVAKLRVRAYERAVFSFLSNFYQASFSHIDSDLWFFLLLLHGINFYSIHSIQKKHF